MNMLYHGTPTHTAIEIAEAGYLASPYELEYDAMKILHDSNPELFLEFSKGKSLEEFALFTAGLFCCEHEAEYRVKKFSLTRNLEGAIIYAERHPPQFRGVVLGLDVPEVLLPEGSENNIVVYVPGKLSLEHLREVHLSDKAVAEDSELIRKAFSRYGVEYKKIKK